MIVEIVVCDFCNHTQHMKSGLVPDQYINYQGRHYCTLGCLQDAAGAA